jgi:hypothetical protein
LHHALQILLLDNDGQVHSLMNGTIDVVSPRCGEWSDLSTRAIDLQVVNGRSPWLLRRVWLAVLPGAIGKDVEK